MTEIVKPIPRKDPAVTIDLDRCTGCGACVTACPVDVLRLDMSSGKAVVAYPRDCCFCLLCQDDCPTKAVAVDHNAGNPRQRSIYDTMGIPLPDWAN